MNIKKLVFFSFLVALISPFVFFYFLVMPTDAQESDAIGIQIRTNPNRLSALRWFKEEKFVGAPQVLQVDGYDAIRDGRTVYVNAGNLIGSNFYSNIYLLSYSQDSAPGTSDVFSDMLKHWTFNTNLTSTGKCEISTMACTEDKDCQQSYICSSSDNKCHLPSAEEQALTCWRDQDCPDNIYCSSEKAEITRRTKRYANLTDIRTRIIDSKQKNGNLPKLLSGTYVPSISLSTWPSWNETLARDVDGGQFPVDPLNVMGACNGFDPKTCWNETTRQFVLGNQANRMVQGPANSAFYGYFPGGDTELGYVYSFSNEGVFKCPLNGAVCD